MAGPCQSHEAVVQALDAMKSDLSDIKEYIIGNGKPGILTRLALLESRGWWFPGAVGLVSALFGGVAAYAAVKGLK